jgi:uroporphyrinogen-III decarboxylase
MSMLAEGARRCADVEQLYRERLHRYVTAMRNEKPDRVPIRPLLAEFCGKLAGCDSMQQTHVFRIAFQAVCETARILDCDALVGNMVYVWTGLTQALGLKYYSIPGLDGEADHGFQYLEPPDDQAWMRREEYDHLIADPTGYLYEVWLPRVSNDIVAPGKPATLRNQFALVKGAMAMMQYFQAFGEQSNRLRCEYGMPGALCGILKAPLDILADKLRGYIGLVTDLQEVPEKVLAACQALAPHLLNTALMSADPQKLLPVGFWMHRGCVPFITPEQFRDIQWPTLKPIIENLWAAGHQTLFYAEGQWGAHLDAFAELPPRSIVYHADRDDIFQVHDALGDRFCISGGVPNTLLAYGAPDDVRKQCRTIIEGVAAEGGYIMDASAIVQNDARVENVQAMIEATREYGDYGADPIAEPPVPPAADAPFTAVSLADWNTSRPPGACLPWIEKLAEIPRIQRHPEMVEQVWRDVDSLGNMFIWQVLLSF